MSSPQRKGPRFLALGLVATLIISACGSSSNSGSPGGTSGSGSKVLRVARTIQDYPPDPATWYGAPANDRMMALYEGLYTYEGEGSKLVPQLALSHEVSADGLTYTFKLRPGVKFHDGTPFNAAAAKYSFEREQKINLGAAYMVAGVSSVEAPDDLTLVVHLKSPDGAFLDYQASPYGPKMVSPTALDKNAGADLGQTWLQTHDAGTGPYVLTSLVTDQSEQYDVFPNYWGDKPYYNTIDVSIIPNVTTQLLELEQGQLDLVSSGITPSDLARLSKDSKYDVKVSPAVWTTFVMLNSHKGIFTDPELRKAVRQAIDPAIITEGARGLGGSVPKQFSPYGMLPDGVAAFSTTVDPSVLKGLAATLSDKSVTIRYTISIPPDEQAANLVQSQLQAAGLDAQVVASNDNEMFGFVGHPDQAPDIFVISLNLDTANAASYFQAYLRSTGVLNLNSVSLPDGDGLIDQAIASTDSATAQQLYQEAATLYIDDSSTWPVTNCQSAVVARKGVVVAHSLLDPYGIDFAATTGD
ncbi:MAG: peptide/nickel transport system substrate-binding protein [Ilumatobacteraceae bacterium]